MTVSPSPPTMSCSIGSMPPTRQPPRPRSAFTRTLRSKRSTHLPSVFASRRSEGRRGCGVGGPRGDPDRRFRLCLEGKHTVLAIACGGEFNEQELRRAAGPSPLILFHQAERLLDGQLAKLCSYLASGGNRPAGVLLGVPGLVPRLEKLPPSLFENGR